MRVRIPPGLHTIEVIMTKKFEYKIIIELDSENLPQKMKKFLEKEFRSTVILRDVLEHGFRYLEEIPEATDDYSLCTSDFYKIKIVKK